MLANATAKAAAGTSLDAPQAVKHRPPEFAQNEAAFLAKHWDAWVDEPVPALGNRTPRQAAK